MKTKTNYNGKALPREAVSFTRALIDAGVYPGFFESLTYDVPSADFKFALAVAALSRINEDHRMRSFQFKPIALGWKLKAKEQQCISLRTENQFNADKIIPGDRIMLDQFQPAIEPAVVSVFETKSTEQGIRLLETIDEYGFNETDKKFPEYLREKRLGLGLAHAATVINEFSLRPLKTLDDITPVGGPRSLNRSVFILVDYIAFDGMNDKVGAPTMGWYELRVVNDSTNQDNRLLVKLHTNLDVVIPKGSLVALGNIKWIKPPPPYSD